MRSAASPTLSNTESRKAPVRDTESVWRASAPSQAIHQASGQKYETGRQQSPLAGRVTRAHSDKGSKNGQVVGTNPYGGKNTDDGRAGFSLRHPQKRIDGSRHLMRPTKAAAGLRVDE